VPPPPPAKPEEAPPPPPIEPEEVPPPRPWRCHRPARGGEAAPTRGGEAAEAAQAQGGAAARGAPTCSKSKCGGCQFSVKMLHQAFLSLGKVAIHLGVQRPTDSLQTTVMDYAFKINVLAGDLERGVLLPSTTTMTMTMAASTSPAPAPTAALTPTPTVGLLRRRLPLLN
jgi:hypothetical protein